MGLPIFGCSVAPDHGAFQFFISGAVNLFCQNRFHSKNNSEKIQTNILIRRKQFKIYQFIKTVLSKLLIRI